MESLVLMTNFLIPGMERWMDERKYLKVGTSSEKVLGSIIFYWNKTKMYKAIKTGLSH